MQPRALLYGVCLMAFSVSALAGCGKTLSRSPQVRFGTEQNDARRHLGLPLVDPHWIAVTVDGSVLWSMPEEPGGAPPSHFSKLVTYDGPRLIEEVDFYSNGKRFEVRTPGCAPEVRTVNLVIHFNYERAAAGRSPWSCALCDSATDKEISLDRAEQILASWGLKRVNY
jgi:hypothetical protein